MLQNSLLQIQNLRLNYGSICIGTNISLSLNKGDVLGIAGESGCGKSTLLKSIIDPVEYGIRMSDGFIKYKGKDMSEFSCAQRREMKGTEIGIVLQNPYTTFNPIRPYRKQFAETLKSHKLWHGKASIGEILDLFNKLGLPDGKRILSSCPYEMSGGMNQRISIALSMILQPSLLLADEPTGALDVTSQSQVVEQLWRLRDITDISMIIVSHNLSLIARICDKIAIMYGGRIVEYGDIKDVLLYPNHPYTRRLLKAIPKIHGGRGYYE
ncbi:ABC transporter related [Alkaliphilus metalliredigens QYMF]|uniref:ABC transporter related n=1 Tax=Alkaliphilus metalliredigens (strain QYMF) TaxID=293826 RepID=A6TPU1_ALKMQ|nr:ABC transporter ATP-binding protein [Alkaliphilus metalliredigens]ABR48209.1 ABC transporter related [Alkaliphilus metalliredigens QYMF]